ncbi:MAG: SpoIIE family protein phosphatase [Chloroflexi bacterium]|nr:SpoIIE family protein phosphatase [Chloroflexota bacterium]
MDKNSRLYKIVVKFRPELADMSGLELTGNLMDAGQLLYALPFALITGFGLFLYTDLGVVQQNWPVFLLLLALNILFNRFRYQLNLEVLPGVFASAIGSLDILVVWSAALLFGPTAVWLIILAELGRLIYRWRQDKTGDMRWLNFRSFVDSGGPGALSILIGVWVYVGLGGVHPFPGFVWASLWPAIAATAVAFFFPTVISWPLFRFLANSAQILSGGAYTDSKAMLRFLLISTNLSGLVYPFAILAAGLYAELGVGVYLFFIVGALLASMLAHQLSQAVADSQQRSRELSALEQLGRAIIDAPPQAANLADLLGENMPKMLPLSIRACIWLMPDKILYQNPEKDSAFYIAQAESYLSSGNAPYYEIENVTMAPEGVNGYVYEGLVLPVQSEAGSVLGGIYLHRRKDMGALREFLPMLQSLAAQIASAIRRAEVYKQTLASEKMAQELEVAGRIQASFLPRVVPDIPGWDIVATLEPARQTSGDFYDFVGLEDGRFGILVADVADKGTGAALYMALSRTLIRTYAMQCPDAPEEALRLANERILADTESDQFVTVFYGVIDPAQGSLTYANAGHNPAYLLNGAESAQELTRTGIPLGMFEGMDWKRETAVLQPGSALIMYSDGVTEAQNHEQAEFGEERLLAVLQGETAEGMETAVLSALHNFVGDAPQFDDVTLVIAVRQ